MWTKEWGQVRHAGGNPNDVWWATRTISRGSWSRWRSTPRNTQQHRARLHQGMGNRQIIRTQVPTAHTTLGSNWQVRHRRVVRQHAFGMRDWAWATSTTILMSGGFTAAAVVTVPAAIGINLNLRDDLDNRWQFILFRVNATERQARRR